ncbi:MAG: hypothetical protein AB7S65_02495 [Sulfuricurvum sp.]
MTGCDFETVLKNGPIGSVYLERTVNGLCAGIAVIERFGSSGWVYEVAADPSHPYSGVDKLLHLLFVSGAKYVVFNARERTQYDEIAIHFKNYDIEYVPTLFSDEDANILFSTIYTLNTLLTPIEHLCLENRYLGMQALAQAVHCFRESEHLPFGVPEILSSEGLLELENNPLEQLGVISSDPQLVTIQVLFDEMHTPMGKKLARFRLLMPIRNAAELERRYNQLDAVSPHIDILSTMLQKIGDMEEYWHRLVEGSGSKVFEQSLNALVCVFDYLNVYRIAFSGKEWESMQSWMDDFRLKIRDNRWLKRQSGPVGKLLEIVANIDVAVGSALLARRYALSRPSIVTTGKRDNFVQVMGLRHLLVEYQGIEYIPNDIVLGNRDYLDLPYPDTVMLNPKVHDGAEIRGVLLYGINSSGKSSLMKSLGIAVVLAQAGFYVPARSMKYSIFEGLYTRIVSRDNVAKSLSTFGVEMLELNTIFAHAREKTLVLGDEISQGTETLSAVAIVASTIMELDRCGGLFMITTHLHQLSQIRELSLLRSVVSLHLSVGYDEASDKLAYDRRLKPGRGSSIYGLEFARSLHMKGNFLDNVRMIRDNLAKEYEVLELGHQKEYLKRYREVVACECVICGALIRVHTKTLPGREHHHLIPLCDRHARQVTEGKIKVRGLIMTPSGLRLEYETLLEGI